MEKEAGKRRKRTGEEYPQGRAVHCAKGRNPGGITVSGHRTGTNHFKGVIACKTNLDQGRNRGRGGWLNLPKSKGAKTNEEELRKIISEGEIL